MAHVHVEGEIDAPVETVWGLVGDFGGLVAALGAPAELEGEGIGTLRTIKFGSNMVVERLEELDEAKKRISYSIIEAGPLPVQQYLATMQLAAAGDAKCTLTWSSDFEPAGASEEDAVTAVRGIYDGGIRGLRRHFAG